MIDQEETKNPITRDDLNAIHDRVVELNRNCDNKVSIILGFYAVAATTFFASDEFSFYWRVARTAATSGKLIDIFYLAILLTFLIISLVGITIFIVILYPRTRSTYHLDSTTQVNPSLTFFSDIVKDKDFNSYLKRIKSSDGEDITKSVVMSIHANAVIAHIKYGHFKLGFPFLVGGSILFIVTLIVGRIIY